MCIVWSRFFFPPDSKPLPSDCVELYAVKVDEYDELGKRSSRYSCNLCKYSARDRYNIKIHLDGKHQLGSYPCWRCNRKMKTKQELSRHTLTGCTASKGNFETEEDVF